jgi:hypothetical protein
MLQSKAMKRNKAERSAETQRITTHRTARQGRQGKAKQHKGTQSKASQRIANYRKELQPKVALNRNKRQAKQRWCQSSTEVEVAQIKALSDTKYCRSSANLAPKQRQKSAKQRKAVPKQRQSSAKQRQAT